MNWAWQPIEKQGIKCQVDQETLSLENGGGICKNKEVWAKNYSREEDEEVFWKYYEVPTGKDVLWTGGAVNMRVT